MRGKTKGSALDSEQSFAAWFKDRPFLYSFLTVACFLLSNTLFVLLIFGWARNSASSAASSSADPGYHTHLNYYIIRMIGAFMLSITVVGTQLYLLRSDFFSTIWYTIWGQHGRRK